MPVTHRVAQREAHAHGSAPVRNTPAREDVGNRANEADLHERDSGDEGKNRTQPRGKPQEWQAGQEGNRVDHATAHQPGGFPHPPADDGGGVDAGGGVRGRHGGEEGEQDRQKRGQRQRPPGHDPDAQAGPQPDANHGGGGQEHREDDRVGADDETVGDRQAPPVAAVSTVGDDHGGGTHDRALGDRVEGRDEQDHLGEDEEDTGDEEQVLPGTRGARGLGRLVLGDLRGQGRGIGWAGKHVAGENGKARGVELETGAGPVTYQAVCVLPATARRSIGNVPSPTTVRDEPPMIASMTTLPDSDWVVRSLASVSDRLRVSPSEAFSVRATSSEITA